MRIRLANEGEPGERGGPTGSLYVMLHVKPHPLFHRQENDILLELPINMVQAALGAEARSADAGWQGQAEHPGRHAARRGLQAARQGRARSCAATVAAIELVTVRVVVPDKLDPKQRKLLEELGETLGMESLGKDNRNIFEKFLDAVGDVLELSDGRRTKDQRRISSSFVIRPSSR